MKTVYIQRQVIGWEEFIYEVPDDFDLSKDFDYYDFLENFDWKDWEYLADASEFTGEVEVLDEDRNVVHKLF